MNAGHAQQQPAAGVETAINQIAASARSAAFAAARASAEKIVGHVGWIRAYTQAASAFHECEPSIRVYSDCLKAAVLDLLISRTRDAARLDADVTR